jgi:murein DD-endopeptidase MepM/ murein hydrolase activator NlpD
VIFIIDGVRQMAKGQLNAGSLGGRFLRRTIPQKGRSVPSPISENGDMSTQAKQALPESNRRVKTSAAMIGLAVSVGAYGLPLTHQGDTANAAEPTSSDTTTSSVSKPFEAAALTVDQSGQSAVSDESEASVIQHTVQEGQTLWDVARFYGTDAATLASANNLQLSSVLRVGQVLNIPVDNRIAQAAPTASMTPGYYGLVSGSSSPAIAPSPTNSAQVDAEYKAKQNQSVEVLKQRRESLRSSLASLSAKTQAAAPVAGVTTEAQAASPSSNTIVASAQLSQSPQAAAGNDQQVAFNSSNSFSGAATGTLSTATHRVMPGDTLSGIARVNGVTVKQLMEANRITDANFIFVGQTLTLPSQRNASLNAAQFGNKVAAVPSTTLTDVGVSTLPQSTASPTPTEAAKLAAVTTFPSARPTLESDDSNSRILQLNHVENLKLEIDRMRNKFQAQSGQPQQVARSTANVETPAPVQAVREPVNPEFNPDRYAARLQEIRNRIRPGDRPQTATPVMPQARNSQLMAAAPLGSESYDPIKSRLGKTVSPELPSLGTGSEFLPSVPGQMNGFIWPAKGVLTSGYGWRWGRMHRGIDIAGPIGTPIHAAADGRITYAGWNSGGYGYLVEIQHSDGSLTLYAHNNRILVQVGQEVEQGQQIAEMGSTGYSTGPHLHFEVHPTGKGAANPMAFLPRG